MDMVEVGDERLRSNRHGGGGWRVFEPVEVGDKRSSLNGHGGGGGVWAPMDTTEVGDECSGSI